MPQGAYSHDFVRREMAGLVALGLVLALAGCVHKPSPQAAPPAAGETAGPAVAAAGPDFESAMAAYAAGDYRKAASLFAVLAESEKDPVLAGRAAYAQACSSVLAAETKDELKSAKAAFVQRDIAAQTAGGVDPRLVGPLVRAFRQPCEAKDPAKPSKADAECPRRLTEKEKEVRVLTGQIKALEKIHREIQERKKELSSP